MDTTSKIVILTLLSMLSVSSAVGTPPSSRKLVRSEHQASADPVVDSEALDEEDVVEGADEGTESVETESGPGDFKLNWHRRRQKAKGVHIGAQYEKSGLSGGQRRRRHDACNTGLPTGYTCPSTVTQNSRTFEVKVDGDKVCVDGKKKAWDFKVVVNCAAPPSPTKEPTKAPTKQPTARLEEFKLTVLEGYDANNGGTGCRWIVHEIELYTDRDCTSSTSVESGTESGSPSGYSQWPASHAFDGNAGTFWHSKCSGCPCAKSFSFKARGVKCIKMAQRSGVMAKKIKVERDGKLVGTAGMPDSGQNSPAYIWKERTSAKPRSEPQLICCDQCGPRGGVFGIALQELNYCGAGKSYCNLVGCNCNVIRQRGTCSCDHTC